jgi:exopolysaccharide production protein ExoQ
MAEAFSPCIHSSIRYRFERRNSDFPLISVRHYIRDHGSYLVILVMLTEDDPAVEMLIRRVCYFLIPLSIVLIKYYPQYGRD